ncbi:hypothetical protein BKA67DRAFT_648108 [Truncatella angustata]|uniref:Uncharacterized protein n=1 Tax=Truncatella angustata TaxID=152316 RepID=A0A9P8UHP3_9PEZI|nr:uncharacterized protein BKA67DRAFT_648108 [Truncatella angustata]KAH6652212.1 hypothetical protein BKA67DRAFT_648108 [Truncatella angustata]KAH8196682.1 hypothetical protein TruAng_009150 [Truncatella angustata]
MPTTNISISLINYLSKIKNRDAPMHIWKYRPGNDGEAVTVEQAQKRLREHTADQPPLIITGLPRTMIYTNIDDASVWHSTDKFYNAAAPTVTFSDNCMGQAGTSLETHSTVDESTLSVISGLISVKAVNNDDEKWESQVLGPETPFIVLEKDLGFKIVCLEDSVMTFGHREKPQPSTRKNRRRKANQPDK